jgi:hypothetical protein
MFYGVIIDLDLIKIVIANGLPNNRVKSEVWDHPLITAD